MPLLPGEPPHADDVAERGTKAWRDAVVRHREWIANRAWQAQRTQGLNLSDPEAMKRFLATLGVTNEIGGGRHSYNLFLGQLPSEGFGMSTLPGREGMSYAMEAYMPDWKRWHDRDLQRGLTRAQAEANFPAGMQSFSVPAGTPPPTVGSTAPNVPTGGGMGGGMGASASIWPEASLSGVTDDPWTLARKQLRQRRPGLTLGTLGGTDAY